MRKKDEYPAKVKAFIAMASAVRGARESQPSEGVAPKPWDGYLFFWNRHPDVVKAADTNADAVHSADGTVRSGELRQKLNESEAEHDDG